MAKRYLLDSNTVIDYTAKNYPENAQDALNAIIDEEINVSIITKIEVLSYNPDREDNYQALVEFFEASSIFELDHEIVNLTIETRQTNKIKLPDAIIAATAKANKMTLITRNIKDFKNIPDFEFIHPMDL